MDFIRRMSDKGKKGTGTERIRIAESNRNFLISNPVAKKLMSSFLILGTAFSLSLICTACSCLKANFPLSDSNNCHEKKLEGTWIEKKQEYEKTQTETVTDKKTQTPTVTDKKTQTETVTDEKTQTLTIEVYDTGSKYNIKFMRNNKERWVTHFILTKLESYYFISLYCPKEENYKWEIYRVQFDDNQLLILNLNKEGLELAEEIQKRIDKKIYITISQRELQQWCVQNANLFNEEVFCFERVKGMSTNTRVPSITQDAEDLSKVTVKAKDGVR